MAGKKWSVVVERKEVEVEEVAQIKQRRGEENVGVRFKLHFTSLHFTSAISQFTVSNLRSATHDADAARFQHLIQRTMKQRSPGFHPA